MHIILAIIAVAGAVGYWLWRMRAAADATREIVDAVETVGGAIRRRRFRNKAERNPVDLIEDPREAAAVLLVGLARADGDLTDRQRRHIEAAAQDVMQVEKPVELVARARWMTETTTDPGNLVLRLSRVFQAHLDEAERRQLYGLAEEVAAIEGPVSGIQRQALVRLKERLGL